MRILLDTNIILDILLERKGFVDDSLNAFQKALSKGDRLYLSSSSVTDVFYIIRKQTNSKEKALEAITGLAKLMYFADVNEDCILKTLKSKIEDFEDAVVDEVASHIKADYIITRNINDFKYSKNTIITPNEYLTI